MPILYVVLLLLTSFLWGGNFVFSKFLIGHASPMTLTMLRWFIAVLILFPIVWKTEKNLYPTKKSIFPLFLMGLLNVVLFNIFQFLAIERTTSTNVGLISTLNPLSIAIFSFLLLHEKIKPLQIIAMIVSLMGVLIVLSRGDMNRIVSLQFNVGDLWMIAAVIIWGMYSICSKWVMKRMSALKATFYSGLFGVLTLLPFNLTNFHVSNLSSSFIWALIYSGLVSTVVCMVLWNLGVQKVGASGSGIFLNFNPIFTSILAFFFLGEKMTWTELGGSIVVILGCFLFSYAGSKAKQVEDPSFVN
jgi:drug/metabolite transporter (DMT)-like permease